MMNPRIMDGSDELNKMRAICYRQQTGSYPPEEVKEFFKHIRPSLHIGPSDINGAGDGLLMNKGIKFIKDEIIGAY